MEDQVTTDNQTQDNGAPDNNGADLTSIMSNMGAAETKPESKAEATTDEGKTGDAVKQDKADLPAWTSQLSEEIRANSEVMGQLGKFTKISDLAKSYSELEKKLGNSLSKPGDDASDEEKQAFYQKLGKPESADGYSMKEEEAKQFREIAFKNNLTEEQAKNLYGTFLEIGKNFMQQQQESLEAMARDTQAALKKEYGNNYDSKLRMLTKGVEKYGGKALGEKLQKTGLLYDADVVKMFVLLGEQSSEANGGDNSAAGAGSGYKSTLEGGHFDFSIKN